jgi:hypothetical protein
MEVQVQETEVLGKKWRTGARVSNVVARIKGRGTGKALLLLTHYDSEEPFSFGASDAGSGVGSLLEGLRAYLARGVQPLNDIIVLISDAEELGLLGAQAFVDKHPWSKDVGLVLNFEARGSGGPVVMFVETDRGNEGLIRAFNKANVPHPISNSLFYSVYKLLPNDTDLTIFRQFGNTQGFNFAFIDDHFDYHTSQDNFERLDRNTLQDQASQLMPMLEYFAQADLSDLSSANDLVFFNFPGAGLIHYPFSWVIPMSVLAFILLAGLTIAGVKKNLLSTQEVLRGFLPLFISLATIALVSYFGWRLLLKVHPQYGEIWQGFPYNGHLYITGFVCMALWLTLRVYRPYLKKANPCALSIPPLLLWLLISFGSGFYLPGGGFVALIVIAGILILGIFIFGAGQEKWRVILSTLISLPVLVIFVPMVVLFPIALGLKTILIGTLLASMLLLPLLPIIATYPGLKNLSKFLFIVALLTFASASYSSGFSAESKRPDSILYLRNGKGARGFWASRDLSVDEFTSQFLGSDAASGDLPDPSFKAASLGGYTFYQGAEPIELPPSSVTTLKDSTADGRRFLKIRINPRRKVNWVDLRLQGPTSVYSLEVLGEPAEKKEKETFLLEAQRGRHLFRYYLTETQPLLEFSYSVPEGDDPSLFLIEVTHNFQNVPEIRRILADLTPRQEHLMEKPFITNDALLNLVEINF